MEMNRVDVWLDRFVLACWLLAALTFIPWLIASLAK
jgi:hypothetical protein